MPLGFMPLPLAGAPQQIVFDAVSSSGSNLSATTYTWTHTCSGNDRLLTVVVIVRDVGPPDPTVTYNGVALTLVRKSGVLGSTIITLYTFRLINPASGANTVSVTIGSAIQSSAGAVSFWGVNQSRPTEADIADRGASGDITVNVTTVADMDWVIDFVANEDTTIAVGPGQIERLNITNNFSGQLGISTEGPKTPAGSVTMSWINNSFNWVTVAMAIRPSSAAGATTFNQTLSATNGSTATLIRSVGKTLSVARASTATVTKSIGKFLTLTQASSASLVKSAGKTLSTSEGSTATLTKAIVYARILTVAQASTATLSKGIGKILSVAQATTATISKSIGKQLLLAQHPTATLLKVVGKIMSLAEASIVTLAVSTVHPRTLTVTEGSTPTLTKSINKILSVARASVATIGRVIGKLLSVSEGSTPTITKNVGKLLSVSRSSIATVLASFAYTKSLTATEGSTATISKSIGKTLSVVRASIATITYTKAASVVLSVQQASIATMSRIIGKTLFVVNIPVAFIGSQTPVLLQAVQGSLASLIPSRTFTQVLSATSSIIATIIRLFVPGIPPTAIQEYIARAPRISYITRAGNISYIARAARVSYISKTLRRFFPGG